MMGRQPPTDAFKRQHNPVDSQPAKLERRFVEARLHTDRRYEMVKGKSIRYIEHGREHV